MIKRFIYAFKCFKYAWQDYRPHQKPMRSFENWMLANESFLVGTYFEFKKESNNKLFDSKLLSKRCISEDGRVRYFPVVPEGYDLAIKETRH